MDTTYDVVLPSKLYSILGSGMTGFSVANVTQQGILMMAFVSPPASAARRDAIRRQLAGSSPAFAWRFAIGTLGLQFARMNALRREDDASRDLLLLSDLSEPNRSLECWNLKSLALFRALARRLAVWRYEWYAKVDMDSFVVWPNLLRELVLLRGSTTSFASPARDGHYGLPCSYFRDDPRFRIVSWHVGSTFMCGGMYMVTRDVVEWMARNPPWALVQTLSPDCKEDRTFTLWLNDGQRGRNGFACDAAHCIDFHEGGVPFHADTIYVHRVKTTSQWRQTASHFEAHRDALVASTRGDMLALSDNRGGLAARAHTQFKAAHLLSPPLPSGSRRATRSRVPVTLRDVQDGRLPVKTARRSRP